MSVDLQERMKKFMQSVGDNTWKDLQKEAKARDISVQELIRVLLIPIGLKEIRKT